MDDLNKVKEIHKIRPSRVEVISQILQEANEPSYRLTQICEFIFKNPTKKYSEMVNIPKVLRDKIIETLGTDEILTLQKLHEVEGTQVKKYLFSIRDNERLESVLMFYNNNHTSLCVSTQVGCGMMCKFCTTGTLVGFRRNLSVDEIVDQILFFKKEGINIDSVFFSGMGEPFANPNFFKALEMLIKPTYLGMAARKFSVSTVGIVPGIKELTEKFPQVNLALSLHFAENDLRTKYMPITKAYNLNDVLDALNTHAVKTKRKIFLAYVMLKGINDSLDNAKQLVNLVKYQTNKSYLFHVNLIEFHEGTTEENYKCATPQSINAFKNYLLKNNISVTVRMSFGEDIEAACGQLYAKYKEEENIKLLNK